MKDAGKWVSPSEVSSMRCDGVVEYIYEYYGFRVYGSSSDWDVSKASFDIREKHSRTNITPKKQVNYLTLVDDDVPN